MSFESILRPIVDTCGGGIAIALMESDGIAIEQVAATAPAAAMEDIGAAGVEFGRILDDVRKASDSLGGGSVGEATFSLAAFSLIVSVIDPDTFLALAIAPDGNVGKARYLMRRSLPLLREQL
jgi:predicted regulator of Ras-like GTPase activity (Roadblock/LC7/MglB family)